MKSRTEIEFIIDEYIHHARNRQILKDRLLDGMIYEDIAEKHNLTARQVQNIVYKETSVISKLL